MSDGGEADPVLELTVDQIDLANGDASTEVLNLEATMEVADAKSRMDAESDPFVRIRKARARPVHESDGVPFGPPVLPRMVTGDWGMVLTGSLAALEGALRAARQHANFAKRSQERTKAVLYRAISSAYDLALTVRDAPEAYAALLAESGIALQPRAPMTPIIKLVFGTDYDRTRIAEYAAVLAHAARHNVRRGDLEGLLAAAPGGIKSVVALERRARAPLLVGSSMDRPMLSARMMRRLRSIPLADLCDLSKDGEEFSLALIRRTDSGHIALIAEVPADPKLMRLAVKDILDQAG